LTWRRCDIPVLGIDVGTSGSRALVLDESRGLLASQTADHAAFASPQTAWAEQDPDDWWRACQVAIRAVVAASGVGADSIAAIGPSGQMHGAVLLDERGGVLRPAIIWCDQRTEGECRWLNQAVGPERLLQLTSNPALTNFTLTKLLWIRSHEPEVWRRVAHVLLPKDYVRYRLSGELATDVADASGTLLLDVARRGWSQEMLDAAGIDRRLLPAVFESTDICARVSREAAAITGLPGPAPSVPRLAPRVWCSPRPIVPRPMRRGGCTRSVTPCRASGM
jgi:xylulokinase